MFLSIDILKAISLSLFSSSPLPPLFAFRIKAKIVEPYNKIVARTAQLARLQVGSCFYFFIL
jgi:hypothetical protein